MAGGSKPAPSSSTVTQVQQIPEFLEDAYLEAIDRARAVSTGEFTPYQGQRIAGFSEPSEQAFGIAESGVGRYEPVYGAGVANTAAASETFNPAEFAKFMDPYSSQVTDEMARLGNRNFMENLMPKVNAQFTGAGMFGSSKNQEVLGRAARDVQADISGKQAEYLSKGFGQSMDDYAAAMGRKLSAGAQLSNQAAQGQQMQGTDINTLRNVGEARENKQQLGLDTAYNQFLEQRDYPKAQVGFFSDIARGISPQGMVTTQTQNIAPQANPINQALGAGIGLYQAQQTGRGFKKGGHVKAKRQAAKKKSGSKALPSSSAMASSMTSPGIGGMVYG